MCIKKVEAWSFDGQTYDSERKAIRAAVGKIVNNPGVAEHVINSAEALLPYLERVIQLDAPVDASGTTATGTEVTSEKLDGEPKRLSNKVLIDALRQGGIKTSLAAQRFIDECGYQDFEHFLRRATTSQRREMAGILEGAFQ